MTARAAFYMGLVAAACIACEGEVTVTLLQDPPAPLVDPATEGMHVRADQALASLMLRYLPNLTASTDADDPLFATYWNAVLDATERRGANAYAGTARMFFELRAARPWIGPDYEHEAWIGLALIHAYGVTGDTRALDAARTIQADLAAAWDPAGGLWSQRVTTINSTPTTKTTAVNAGAALLSAELARVVPDPSLVSFASKVLDFWSAQMVDAQTGHVSAAILQDGARDETRSSANEGLMIAALVAAAEETRDESRIALAHRIAAFMLSNESATTSLGTILSDGPCQGASAMAKAVAARALATLYSYDPSHTEYRDFLHRSGDAAWTLALGLSNDDIACDWAGPYDATTGGIASLGSAAEGLASAAIALGAGTQRPLLRYEAEESDLHGVGLGKDKPGFSGWGYVVGWGKDGQSIDVPIEAPSAGHYVITFRYAGGSAHRSFSIDGAPATTLTFAGTGDYLTYEDVATEADLAAGNSTLTLAFDAAHGSDGYLNLDRIDLSMR